MARSTKTMTEDQAQHRLWQLIRKIDYCMFTTHAAGGGLRSRPMSTIVREDDDQIFVLSDRHGGKDEEIHANPDVVLSFANGSTAFVSVNGQAVISNDRALIKSLWTAGAQAFWPDGPDDPDVFAIIVTPDEAEYWEGNNGLVAGVKFAYAIATGSKPDLGENRKVAL